MTNIESIKKGFIKRAQEYGLHQYQGEQLFKTAEPLTGPQQWLLDNQAPVVTGIAGLLGGGLTTGPGALIGAGLGGITGLLDGTKDENGETHRMRNALRNAGIGGGLGAAAGFGAGALGTAIKTYPAFNEAYGQQAPSLGK
jgi:hypothetical protein